jgi:hypothetical protein
MISQAVIWKLIANAIEASRDVQGVLAEFSGPLKIHVGHDASAVLQLAASPVISIAPMDAPVDFGHSATTRDVPVMIRFAFTDDEMTDDNVRVSYRGVYTLDNLGLAILGAVKAISGLGDELAVANYYIDTAETFPLCSGRIECVFKCQRGLAFEPSASEI